jgi:uncharacterized protein YwqG
MDTSKPEDAVNALMDRFARPCIRIYRPFPPPRVRSGRSKFGGLPNLPPDLQWPNGRSHHRTTPKRTPLHFMAQIDLSELPRCDSDLPESGMLYFFANSYDEVAWDHLPNDFRRVLYAPQVAADQAVRQPPEDMPVIDGAHPDYHPYINFGTAYPRGHFIGHRPDDPLTRKVFYEWPVEFVVTDSYPPTDAMLATRDWAQLVADFRARSETDPAFGDQYGRGDMLQVELQTIYQEGSRDRMADAFYKAIGMRPTGYESAPQVKQKWRQMESVTGNAFPPVAAFASEIAAAIDNVMGDQIVKQEQQRDRGMQPPERTVAGITGFLRKILGGGSPPPVPPKQPLPDWVDDLGIVRREAGEWLAQFRALAADQPLDPQLRERFLVWLDGLEASQWARIGGHKPQVSWDVQFAFDQAMFQLVRLANTHETIRAHVPDALCWMYARQGFPGYAWHQMLGYFPSSQAGQSIDDPMVPLLMLSYDDGPDLRIGDLGEMQFFIGPGDLRHRNFASVEVQMQGG